MTFLMSSSGDIGFPDIQPKFFISFADGTRESRQIFFSPVPIPPAFLLFISAIAALGSLGWWRRAALLFVSALGLGGFMGWRRKRRAALAA
jgi:hypothetical protein